MFQLRKRRYEIRKRNIRGTSLPNFQKALAIASLQQPVWKQSTSVRNMILRKKKWLCGTSGRSSLRYRSIIRFHHLISCNSMSAATRLTHPSGRWVRRQSPSTLTRMLRGTHSWSLIGVTKPSLCISSAKSISWWLSGNTNLICLCKCLTKAIQKWKMCSASRISILVRKQDWLWFFRSMWALSGTPDWHFAAPICNRKAVISTVCRSTEMHSMELLWRTTASIYPTSQTSN